VPSPRLEAEEDEGRSVADERGAQASVLNAAGPGRQTCQQHVRRSSTYLRLCAYSLYPVICSRSPKNPALQQLQKSSKSASAAPQSPMRNSFATVGVRDFWENGCTLQLYIRVIYNWEIPSNEGAREGCMRP